MDTGTSHSIARHQTRLVNHVVSHVANGLLAGVVVALAIGWAADHFDQRGWIPVAPGVGLAVLAVFMLWSHAPEPPDEG